MGSPSPGVTGSEPRRSVIIRVSNNPLIQLHPSPAVPSGDPKALAAASQVSLLVVKPVAPFLGEAEAHRGTIGPCCTHDELLSGCSNSALAPVTWQN